MEKDELVLGGKVFTLVLGGKVFTNRLFTGTGKFARNEDIAPMLEASGSQMVTVALRRIDFKFPQENILNFIPKNVTLLPNTSGARNCAEAVKIARIAREAGCGRFIKIEIINDSKYLLPDNAETVKATEILAKEGFVGQCRDGKGDGNSGEGGICRSSVYDARFCFRKTAGRGGSGGNHASWFADRQQPRAFDPSLHRNSD